MAPDGPDYLTIVSGLPRSGTSMMMRMLEAGGIPVMTDEIRVANEDNPAGYFELEAVKKTREDDSWLRDGPGRAVKMIYRLLRDLPGHSVYRVLFLRRRLVEIHASQEAMLRRSGKDASSMDLAAFERLFNGEIERSLQWLGEQPNFAVLEVDYNALVENPPATISDINAFLDHRLDVGAMQGIIAPGLYRQRA